MRGEHVVAEEELAKAIQNILVLNKFVIATAVTVLINGFTFIAVMYNLDL